MPFCEIHTRSKVVKKKWIVKHDPCYSITTYHLHKVIIDFHKIISRNELLQGSTD